MIPAPTFSNDGRTCRPAWFHLTEDTAAQYCCCFNYIQNSNACIHSHSIIIIMKGSCRSCNKTFHTNSNGNQHERSTGHGPKDTSRKRFYLINENGVYLCPTENCKTYAHTKRSIKRHLKNFNQIIKNRKKHEQNKICKYCQKRFQKFNRDRHVKQCHGDEINDGGTIDFIDINVIVVEVQPDEELPTMVQTIHSESPEEQPPTVAQGTPPIPPKEQPPTAVQQTSPIPTDE